MIEIRPYKETDRDMVIELWQEVFPDTPAHNVPDKDIQRKMSVQRELFLVATKGLKILGTAMAGYDGHRGWVYYVAVNPYNQRKGIGTALMKRVELELKRMGCPKLNLQVRATNQGVAAFYKKLGYDVEDRLSLGKRLEDLV